MRIFFTGDHPMISLLDDSHEIIADPDLYQSHYLDTEEPESSDYPLRRILRNILPEVVVLVDFLKITDSGQPLGYHVAHVRSWQSELSGRIAVGLLGSDKEMWGHYMTRRFRKCIAQPHHCRVFVTGNMDVANFASKSMRTVYFDGQNPDAMIRAINAARKKSSYRPDVEEKPYL